MDPFPRALPAEWGILMNAISDIVRPAGNDISSPAVPDLGSYDRILVAFSGGKDSLACLLDLLDRGVPASRIEMHHHDIDGHGGTFMDWPVTAGYCRAVAAALGIPIYFSHKEGGFLREMLREDSLTAPISFETPDGTVGRVGGERGKPGTRRRFPQVSADLSVRWCSAYLKIDVMAAAIRNQDRFLGSRTLVVTGERAQESTSRAKYATFEPHRSDTRDGTGRARHVDHWRPIHAWDEARVWDAIRRHGIVPHVAYQLGWGRLSCRACIFGSPNQWATIRLVFPECFEAVAAREDEFGVTIQRARSIRALADIGTPYPAAIGRPDLVRLANSAEWDVPVVVDPASWQMPAGAFGDSAGPT